MIGSASHYASSQARMFAKRCFGWRQSAAGLCANSPSIERHWKMCSLSSPIRIRSDHVGVMECWSSGVMNYETELRNKNRGYMKLIVWQRAMELFELVWAIVFIESKIDFKLRSQI